MYNSKRKSYNRSSHKNSFLMTNIVSQFVSETLNTTFPRVLKVLSAVVKMVFNIMRHWTVQ